MNEMKFNEQQIEAIKKCVTWYYTETFRKQIFTLAGYAGTGKTTIVHTIIKMMGLNLVDTTFATLTAKASLVLRLKGNPSNTIHKTFYKVFKSNKGFCFKLKQQIPNSIKLIIIDEASMINQKMLNDIASFKTPIILIFDPGQLPPIFGSNYYVYSGNYDVFLTEIMRQTDTTGIIELSMKARKGEGLSMGKHKSTLITTYDKVLNKIHEYDVVLCYSNKMRRTINKLIRKKLKYTSKYPIKGEKVLCMANNYNYEIMYKDLPIYIINGLISIVTEDSKLINDDSLSLLNIKMTPEFLLDSDNLIKTFDIMCFKEIFEQYEKQTMTTMFVEDTYKSMLEDDKFGKITIIDYGYALTTHKSQGAQWSNVLVINDFKGQKDTYDKWLYTAITRAVNSVTIAFIN